MFSAEDVTGAMEDAASVAGTERVDIRMREYDAVDMEIDGERGVNLENELAAADGLGEAFDLTPSMMASRATCMFTEGNGKPRGSEEPAIATKPTLWLVKLAKEAVSELFVHHRDEVQQSWGEPLDQEEALGYLVCDALGCELVPDEARSIGKKATLAITCPRKGAKQADTKLKGSASAKRAKARRAAEKSEEKRAALRPKLAGIDAERDAKRVELWGSVLDVRLPRGQIVQGTAPVPAVEMGADAAVAAAEAKLAAAQAARAEAALAHDAAERAQLKLIPRALRGEGGPHEWTMTMEQELRKQMCAAACCSLPRTVRRCASALTAAYARTPRTGFGRRRPMSRTTSCRGSTASCSTRTTCGLSVLWRSETRRRLPTTRARRSKRRGRCGPRRSGS